MIGSVRAILSLETPKDFLDAQKSFDAELEETLTPLATTLDMNVVSTDITSLETHMAYVERWRYKIVRYLSLATGFVEHAKSSTFLPVREKGVTAIDRDAVRRKMAACAVALQVHLEGLIDCIDSRVNLCKKLLGIEGNGNPRRS